MSTKGIKPRNEVPLSTLLHFTNKDLLETFLGGESLARLKSAAVASGSKSLTKKDIIRSILSSEEASAAYNRSDMASTAYQKYKEMYQRLQNPEAKQRSAEARQQNALGKKQFLGCMISRANPEDTVFCAQNYDKNPAWGAVDISKELFSSRIKKETDTAKQKQKR